MSNLLAFPTKRHVAAAESTMFDAIYHQVRITDNIEEAKALDAQSDSLFAEALRLAWQGERQWPEAATSFRAIRQAIGLGLELDSREGTLAFDRNLTHAKETKCACRSHIQVYERMLTGADREFAMLGVDEGA